ncbi:hypothetical protein R75461_07842 [Paraburkholderia nemoris]|uniref:hypothetical protein n=1 Tax=Paraburkholderia nemoris TaxID=2793076 RepID=UPI00190B2E38|nr:MULTISPECIES: hypothetical protein [Paraburkholderia]MBK3786588.1 hypothetical protein [Paraburkholderia aspalathi]CAE6858293.1 hypothetical protein R75461_07842 [Paraburkholderia nemoris]
MMKRNSKPGFIAWLVASVLSPLLACQLVQAGEPVRPLSQRLADAALEAPAAAQPDGSLYGVPRWNAATGRTYLGMKFPGVLSCAYTVSAILRKAGHPVGALASVRQVDSVLSRWPKISDPDALQPGDVVFWKPRRVPVLGSMCGTVHWHVGISTGGTRTVDNDWWSGQPQPNTVSRVCSVFAYARRPAEQALSATD